MEPNTFKWFLIITFTFAIVSGYFASPYLDGEKIQKCIELKRDNSLHTVNAVFF